MSQSQLVDVFNDHKEKTMYAHYFKGRGRQEVIITRSPALTLDEQVTTVPVASKTEARKVAKQYSAQPWNF